MTDNPKLYAEVCNGLIRSHPPQMIKAADLAKWQAEHQSSNAGLFASIFSFEFEDPYVGGVISPFYIDFDQEENPDRARKDAVTTIKKLIDEYKIPESVIAIAFSGMKGVSITISHTVFNAEPSDHLPLVWKSILQELGTKLKLKTADFSVYDRRRLWRLLNSKHNKTGLYKIPLTLTELEKLSMTEIKELAAKPREPFLHADAVKSLPAETLYHENKEKVETWLSVRKEKFESTGVKNISDDPPCIKKLLELGAKKGNRNNQTFQLAVYFASKGLSQEEIEKLCTEFTVAEPLRPQEISTIVDSALKGYMEGRYSVGCSTFSDICNKPKCPLFAVDETPNWDKIGEPISFDEWRQTILNNFPDLWPYTEGCASTVAALLIKNVSPLALVSSGRPRRRQNNHPELLQAFPSKPRHRQIQP